MKIACYVYCRNKLVSQKKSVKWSYKPAFYAFTCFSITENQSLWPFQSDRLIPLVPHTSAIKVTKIIQFLLI